jgi:hypothetical protein
MSQRGLKNVPASIRVRLLNEAKASGDSYDQVLQYFAIERFLYRLSKTQWGERLIVKGAIMLRAWGTPLGRPTRDIDFLGKIDNSPEAVERAVRECLAVEYPDDGLVFAPDIETAEINVMDRYPGVRIVVRGNLDGGTFKLQLDIGIDDAVVPDPEWIEYPTLLDLDSPRPSSMPLIRRRGGGLFCRTGASRHRLTSQMSARRSSPSSCRSLLPPLRERRSSRLGSHPKDGHDDDERERRRGCWPIRGRLYFPMMR